MKASFKIKLPRDFDPESVKDPLQKMVLQAVSAGVLQKAADMVGSLCLNLNKDLNFNRRQARPSTRLRDLNFGGLNLKPLDLTRKAARPSTRLGE